MSLLYARASKIRTSQEWHAVTQYSVYNNEVQEFTDRLMPVGAIKYNKLSFISSQVEGNI